MGTKARIEGCKSDEIDELRQFIDGYWRQGHTLAQDEALLRWQFDPSRANSKMFQGLSVLLAWEDGRIVGMLGLIPFDLNLRGVVTPGVWLSQWYAAPATRTRGLGLELLWAARDLGYEAVFALGANEVARTIYSILGFEMLPEMPRFVRVFDVEKTARLLAEAEPKGDPNTFRQLCAGYTVRAGVQESTNERVNVSHWEGPFGADWDSFWTGHLTPLMVGPNKNSSYLNWRYVDHPTFKYEIRMAHEAATGKVMGASVFRVEEVRDHEEKVLRVVEFLSTPEAVGPLAGSVQQSALECGVAFGDFYSTSEQLAAPLRSMGFRRYLVDGESPGFPSRFRPLDPGHDRIAGAFWLSKTLRSSIGELLRLEDFYITKSDSDQDRPN